jgi:hypothetical protein
MNPGQQRIQELLLPGERLIWSGQPDPLAHFVPADFFLVPFSLMWGGFAVFWEVTAVTGGAPVLFLLWGIPFVAIGLYFIVGRFFYKSYTKARTVYALTDRRIMVLKRGSALDEISVGSGRAAMSTSQFAGRMSVRFGAEKPSFFSPNAQADFYANTGMELLLRRYGSGIRFHDVIGATGLTAALNDVRMLTAS